MRELRGGRKVKDVCMKEKGVLGVLKAGGKLFWIVCPVQWVGVGESTSLSKATQM